MIAVPRHPVEHMETIKPNSRRRGVPFNIESHKCVSHAAQYLDCMALAPSWSCVPDSPASQSTWPIHQNAPPQSHSAAVPAFRNRECHVHLERGQGPDLILSRSESEWHPHHTICSSIRLPACSKPSHTSYGGKSPYYISVDPRSSAVSSILPCPSMCHILRVQSMSSKSLDTGRNSRSSHDLPVASLLRQQKMYL